MKRCTGCGRTNDKPLGLNSKGEPFLACCPDNDYKEVDALDWFWHKVNSHFQGQDFEDVVTTFAVAKLKFREQIYDAYSSGADDEYEYHVNSSVKREDIDCEKYYNRTYGK